MSHQYGVSSFDSIFCYLKVFHDEKRNANLNMKKEDLTYAILKTMLP
jgi:hypothetical protein